MDPLIEQAKRRHDAQREAQKKEEAGRVKSSGRGRAQEVSLLTPGVLKLVFAAFLVALFLIAVAVQFTRNKLNPNNDPASEMREQMGLIDSEGNTYVPSSTFDSEKAKLGSGDPVVRMEGMDGIVKENVLGAMPIIRRLLSDPDPQVRAHATKLFGEHPTRGYASALVPLLSDPIVDVRRAAGTALNAYTDDAGVLYLLSSALSHADPAVALNAIEVWKVFSRKDEPSAARVIIEAFRSQDDAVLIAAMNAAANGLTSDHLSPLKGEYVAVQTRKAGQPAGDEATRIINFINLQSP